MNSHKFDEFGKINSIQKLSVIFSENINYCETSVQNYSL